jgi:hypothetical protein
LHAQKEEKMGRRVNGRVLGRSGWRALLPLKMDDSQDAVILVKEQQFRFPFALRYLRTNGSHIAFVLRYRSTSTTF